MAELTPGERDEILEGAIRALLDAERAAYAHLDLLDDDGLASIVSRYTGRNATFANTLARLASSKLMARKSRADG